MRDYPGSIAIVLDYSGSMRARTANGEPKIEVAKQALRTVLLNTIPAGATVSFWIFSQVPRGSGAASWRTRSCLEPERTIKQLWNPRPGTRPRPKS